MAARPADCRLCPPHGQQRSTIDLDPAPSMPGLTFAGAALQQHASHLLRVVPRRQVPAPAQHNAAHAVRQRPRTPHEPVVLRPRQASRARRSRPDAVKRLARIASLTAWKPGAVAYARTSRSAASGGMRSGWAALAASTSRRPRSVRSSGRSTGSSARAPARTRERLGTSGSRHRPGGGDRGRRRGVACKRHLERHPAAERVARHVRPLDPLGGRAGRRSRRRARVARRRSSGGSSPWPGRSGVSTRRAPSSRSTTGSHIRWSVPSVCRRTSGSLSGPPPPPPPR